ncbi:MAG TPA: sigma-70 family RNA polymerase sigma factor, partial [Bacteroidales bacterium]|nr:sigma-70 family RNA polymerase sigma factor [Bacteroidales bacterium]
IFDHLARFEYRNEFSLSKWIRTIVINEAIRLINSRNQLQYSDDLATYETGLDSEYEAEDIDPEHIYSIIENMPAGYRIVFNLFAIEGYSHKEISELLNISENTSKSQLRKARMYIIEKNEKTTSVWIHKILIRFSGKQLKTRTVFTMLRPKRPKKGSGSRFKSRVASPILLLCSWLLPALYY